MWELSSHRVKLPAPTSTNVDFASTQGLIEGSPVVCKHRASLFGPILCPALDCDVERYACYQKRKRRKNEKRPAPPYLSLLLISKPCRSLVRWKLRSSAVHARMLQVLRDRDEIRFEV